MPTVSSVHSPQALNTISIRGGGPKKKEFSIYEISEYAKVKGMSFVVAFRELIGNAFCSDKEKK